MPWELPPTHAPKKLKLLHKSVRSINWKPDWELTEPLCNPSTVPYTGDRLLASTYSLYLKWKKHGLCPRGSYLWKTCTAGIRSGLLLLDVHSQLSPLFLCLQFILGLRSSLSRLPIQLHKKAQNTCDHFMAFLWMTASSNQNSKCGGVVFVFFYTCSVSAWTWTPLNYRLRL